MFRNWFVSVDRPGPLRNLQRWSSPNRILNAYLKDSCPSCLLVRESGYPRVGLRFSIMIKQSELGWELCLLPEAGKVHIP